MSIEQYKADLDELRTRAYRRGFATAVQRLALESENHYRWMTLSHIDRLWQWAATDPIDESHNDPPRPEA